MTKLPAGIIISAALIALAGCASRAETVGTAGGAVLGNAATGGSALGTAGGGGIGYEDGQNHEPQHRRRVLPAATPWPRGGVARGTAGHDPWAHLQGFVHTV